VALYLYGIVRAARLPERLARRGLRLLSTGRLAVLAATVDESPLRASRQNLLAHADVVEDAFGWTTVLPMRFGVVLPDAAAVRDLVLDPNRELLEELLIQHQHTAELSLTARYDEDAVMAELVARNGRLARLRKAYRVSPTLDRGMELGEAVAAVLGVRRDRDAGTIFEALRPLALDVRASDVELEGGVAKLAWLVERDRVDEFDRRLGQLSAALSPPIRFKLVGPLPPYSFVDVPLAVPA